MAERSPSQSSWADSGPVLDSNLKDGGAAYASVGVDVPEQATKEVGTRALSANKATD